MKTKSEKWTIFWNVATSPGSVIFVILTFVSLIFAYLFKENLLFSTLLSILGSFFAGFAGSFIKDDYDKIAGQNILEKKGRSALRTLESLSRQVKRICSYIRDVVERNKKPNQEFLIELSRHMFSIEDYISSSVEDWVDVVPELAETMEELRKINKLTYEIETLKQGKKQYKRSQKLGEKKENDLRKVIEEKEELLKELRQKRNESVNSVFLDSSLMSKNSPINMSVFGQTNSICEICKEPISPYSSIFRLNSKRCDSCQEPSLLSDNQILGL